MDRNEQAVSDDERCRLEGLSCWQGPIDIRPLEGGITNRNFVVRDGARSFVARLCEERRHLGIDRANESRCQQAAAAEGIAPQVVLAADGVLVSEFVSGRTLDAAALADEKSLRSVAEVLHRLHDSRQRLTGELLYVCPFQTVRTYLQTAQRLGARGANAIEADVREATEMAGQLATFQPTLCHNDLLPANWILDDQRLWLVDWEYAGIGNPLFDLASVVANANLKAEAQAWLLETYDGQVRSARVDELQILLVVSQLREGLWALIQTVASDLDFDYAEYAAQCFDAYRTARRQLS